MAPVTIATRSFRVLKANSVIAPPRVGQPG
jgi:hypothetical protein